MLPQALGGGSAEVFGRTELEKRETQDKRRELAQSIRKENGCSFEAAELATRALDLLEEIKVAGSLPKERKAAKLPPEEIKIKLRALMEFFDSDAIENIYPPSADEEAWRETLSGEVTGLVFENLARRDKSVEFNRLGKTAENESQSIDRDSETEQLVLKLLQSDEPLMPVGSERRVGALAQRVSKMWPSEEHFRFHPTRQSVSNPDDLAIRPMPNHFNWGEIYGMAECKLTVETALSKQGQLQEFYGKLQQELNGGGSEREASINQALPVLQTRFGLQVFTRLTLAREDEMEKHLILPVDQKWPDETLQDGRYQGWKIDHSVFTGQEVYALALKFIPEQLSLSARYSLNNTQKDVEVETVEVSLAGPENRSGPLVNFEVVTLDKTFLTQLQRSEAKVSTNQAGFLQARFPASVFVGDQLTNGGSVPTSILFKTPVYYRKTGLVDSEQMERDFYDLLNSLQQARAPVVVATLYHNLANGTNTPNRSLNLYIGKKATNGPANYKQVAVDYESKPLFVKVKDGKLQIGDYEWGKPQKGETEILKEGKTGLAEKPGEVV